MLNILLQIQIQLMMRLFSIYHFFHAGYGNTTSAINAIRFQMSSGNIDDGIIKLYGVK
jgi:hypothetical protein